MIDTHCHLTDHRLGSQLSAVLQRASAAGVHRMITIGTSLPDDQAAIELCRDRDFLRCAIGVHPNHAHEVDLAELPKLRAMQADPSVVALGEMGLDYFHAFVPKPRQFEVFTFQLNLAIQVNKPVVIHCREAIDDCLAIMNDFPSIWADFHCFTGSPDEARRILDQGYLLGFTGAATYKKNDGVREAVALTPMDRLLVETDAPYLTPEPMRKQKVNEPALVVHVADAVGRVKGLSREQVDQQTTANAAQFFNWG